MSPSNLGFENLPILAHKSGKSRGCGGGAPTSTMSLFRMEWGQRCQDPIVLSQFRNDFHNGGLGRSKKPSIQLLLPPAL